MNVLSKANSGTLYDTYTDPEKTIFNQYLIEIIPILNKFYEKVIDVQLPKILDDLIDKTKQKIEENEITLNTDTSVRVNTNTNNNKEALSKFELKDRVYKGKITKDMISLDYSNAYRILTKEREKSFEFMKSWIV